MIDIVQKVITQNNPEKMEVKVGKRVYLVVFHPLPEQECVNISGFDISDQKELEEKLPGSEVRDMSKLELAEIIDTQAIQSLLDDFYKLVHIPIGINDLKGNVLVGVGWQDICTKFHRVHPEACKHCIESDIKLSAGVLPGKFKLYKCKNNMWDMATPIIVGNQHVGYVFSGQFFFEDEPLDYELFRSQARKYGFNEEEYIAALEKVPRLSRKAVDTGMSFLMTFANMVSQLSYNNIKLAQSLAERDSLVEALQKNREDLDRAQAVGNLGSWRLNVRKDELTWSDEAHRIFGVPKGTPLTYETFLSTVHMDDRKYVDKKWKAGLAGEPYDIEHRIIVDSKVKWVREKAYIEFNNDGMLFGGFGITQDITERKRAEEALLQSEQHYRLLYETMLQGVVYQDANGKIISMNPAAEKILGKTPAEFLGSSSMGEEHLTIRENGSPFPGLEHPAMVSLRTGRKVQNVVMGVYNPREKRYRWININAVPIFRAGEDKPFQVYTLFDDITERKHAEEMLSFERSQLLSIFDGIDDVVYVTDPYTYEVLYANKAMKEKFGGELVGGICYREFQGRDSPCDFCTNQVILKERDKPYHWEYYNPTVDRYFMIMDRIIKWPDGRDVRFEIAKDITERKQSRRILADF